MIEFTLSKINMLILAVALFGIISFFTLNVGKIFLVGEVRQEMEKYSLTLNTMVVAPTTCDSKPFVIPPRFVSFGNNVFYTMHISTADDSLGKRIIFSASDIRSPDTILAASSLSTTADVVLLDNATGTFFPLGEGESLELDPQSNPPRNAFYAVKSVRGGKSTLYLFPCSVAPNSETCTGTKTLVTQYLEEPINGGVGFAC